ncbi:MAG: hypothetical protein ACF8PN_16020 [Phycisphaerales bacterium]
MRIEDSTFDRGAVLLGIVTNPETDGLACAASAHDSECGRDRCETESDLSPARRLEISWLLGAEFAAEWRLAALHAELADLERAARGESKESDAPLYAIRMEEEAASPAPRRITEREILFIYRSLSPSGRLVDLLM